MLIVGGIYINNLYGILGIHVVPLWLGYPLTILIVVFIINAINLIDGIDGLASGLCGVACLFYGLTFSCSTGMSMPCGVRHIGSVGTVLLLQCFRKSRTWPEDLHGRHG